MTTLAANLSDTAMSLRVNAAVTDPAEFYQIDDEIIWVAAVSTTINGSLSPVRYEDDTLWQIKERGISTTAPASHTSGATVTPLLLGAGGGAGGVMVDNTVDPPAAVTTLVAPGATIAGDEATLRRVVVVGTADEDVTVGSYGQSPGDGIVTAQLWATTAGLGGAIASQLANANGDGDAETPSTASTSGTGNATSGVKAEASGSGNADVTSYAYAETGQAIAGMKAWRGVVTAGLDAVVDGTSGRLGFNGTTPIEKPIVPLTTPGVQDVIDALVAYGLIVQSD
jgi:hypothetical protein